jgi:hypothetical protein
MEVCLILNDIDHCTIVKLFNKKNMKTYTLTLVVILTSQVFIYAQGVGVNDDNTNPDASAMLDVKSTTKGLLLPRMTETQRDAISAPATGLLIFQTNGTQGLYFWTGSCWQLSGAANPCVPVPSYPAGSVFCASGQTAVVDVVSPTGKTSMDRNLGASQVATSSTDANSYGDLYQWGRLSDGHQCRTSSTINTLSSTDNPTHGNYITTSTNAYDWRSGQNNNLWQGAVGINNPCPSGYRLPTDTEFDAERQSWSSNNQAGAYASPLKLTAAAIGAVQLAVPIPAACTSTALIPS